MPLRSPKRRPAPRFALLVPMLLMAGFLSGCRWLPRRHPVPSIDPRSVSKPGAHAESLSPLETAPGSANLAHVPLPPLPLMPVSDAEALAATPSRPTPQLDEALQKARALDEAFVQGLDTEKTTQGPQALPEPRPLPEPPMPAESAPPVLEPTPPSEPSIRLDETVSPASLPSEPPPDFPTDPETTWNQALDNLRKLAREQAEQEPSNGPWTTRRSLLERLANSDTPYETENAEPQLWETVLTILAEANADTAPPPETPPFSIADLRLCRQVAGFGQYEPAEPDDVRPGRELMLYWEVEGFQSTQEDDGLYRTRLATELKILPETGDTPLWSRAFNDTEDVCRRPRRDYFVNYRLSIPETLDPGPYRVVLKLQDRETQQTAQRELAFNVAP